MVINKQITTGIDIGTHSIRVVVCDVSESKEIPKIIGISKVESKGMHHGYIIDEQKIINSLKEAIDKAEKNSAVNIKDAYISIGGISLESESINSSISISKNNGEISDLDIDSLIEKGIEEYINKTNNRKIIHHIPLEYILDGNKVLGDPIGMIGSKLESSTLFISCFEHHFDQLVNVANKAGIEILDIIASPVSGSMSVLSQKQKMTGVALVDIGAETVSIAIFEKGKIISVDVFSIGSTDITNDLALGFQISLEEAERIKKSKHSGMQYPKRRIDEIVEARLADIFELIEKHLKKIKKYKLLPAGIILTGGGSALTSIDDYAKNALKLPAQVIKVDHIKNVRRKMPIDPSFFVAYGLCFFDTRKKNPPFKKIFSQIGHKIKSLFEQFLP